MTRRSCWSVGAEIDEIADVIGADPRIGAAFLRAGLGWGGSCFPKDVAALGALAADHGVATPILSSVATVNAGQREIAFRRLHDAARPSPSPTVAVLGLAFKPHTDDLRGSPALDVIARLAEDGIAVRAHDPRAMEAAARVLPNIDYVADPYDAVRGSDALLLATEWPEYVSLDWGRIRRLMRGDVVVDGRNALDPALLGRLGFRYRGFGRANDIHVWAESAPVAGRPPTNGRAPAGAVQVTRTVDVVG